MGWLFRWSWDVSAWVSCYVVLGCFSVWSLFESVLVGLFQWCWDISMVVGFGFDGWWLGSCLGWQCQSFWIEKRDGEVERERRDLQYFVM